MISEIAAVTRQVRSTSIRSTKAQEQWGSLVPAAICDTHRDVRLSRGVLTVSAKSASTAAAIRQWLASGGENAVRSAMYEVRLIKVTTR